MAQVFWNLDVVATFMTGYYENGNLILEPVKTFGWEPAVANFLNSSETLEPGPNEP